MLSVKDPKSEGTTKPTRNVSTIGHIDHGKTTLTSAITKICSSENLGEYYAYDQIDSTIEEKTRGITINATHITYETDIFFYIHTDCPGHSDYIKNYIVGTSATDVAILVISAVDGVMPQTREHIILISKTGVKNVVVFINKMDILVKSGDEELVVLVEEEVEQLLKDNGYEKPIFVRGSAILALEGSETQYGVPSIKELLNVLNTIPVEAKNPNAPLVMQIESTCSITGRGTIAIGKILEGTATVNDTVELIGGSEVMTTTITEIEMFRIKYQTAVPGYDVGMLLRGSFKRGKGEQSICRGMMLTAPGLFKTVSYAVCEMYVLSAEDGGRRTGFHVKYSPQMFVRAGNVTIFILKIENQDILNPGEFASVTIELQKKTPLRAGDKVIFREGGKTIGGGVLTSVSNTAPV